MDIEVGLVQISPAFPGLADTDGDGVVDVVESFFSSDPNDPTKTPEAFPFGDPFGEFGDPFVGTCFDGNDNDGDGLIDGAELGCPDSEEEADIPDASELFESTTITRADFGPVNVA